MSTLHARDHVAVGIVGVTFTRREGSHRVFMICVVGVRGCGKVHGHGCGAVGVSAVAYLCVVIEPPAFQAGAQRVRARVVAAGHGCRAGERA